MWKKDNPSSQQPQNAPSVPPKVESTQQSIPSKAEKPEKETRSAGYTALDRTSAVARSELASVEPTIISAQTSLKGEISGHSDIKVYGKFKGSIEANKNVVIIEETGHAEATVSAKNITIHGKLVGNATANDTLHLVSTGSVEGDIHAANVILDKGSTFNGSVEMLRERKTKSAEASASTSKPKPSRPAVPSQVASK